MQFFKRYDTIVYIYKNNKVTLLVYGAKLYHIYSNYFQLKFSRIISSLISIPPNPEVIGRGAATGGLDVPPTLKSRGTYYILAPPPTFTIQFILIGWSPPPLHTKSLQRTCYWRSCLYTVFRQE